MDWFPRNIPAYRQDTRHLTTLEHGAYCLLIDEYYLTRSPLPDDDRVLCRIVGLPLVEWQAIAHTIRAFFRPKENLLHLKRADSELDKQDRMAKRRSEKAQKAAMIRHHKNNGLDATSKGQATAEHARAMLGDATETKTYTKTEEERSEQNAPDGASPVPSPKEVLKNGRGKRLDPAWEPSDEDRVFAQTAGLDVADTLASFRDYWTSKAGAGAAKLDWSATWRNWCRRAKDDRQARRGRGGARPSSVVAAGLELLAARNRQ